MLHIITSNYSCSSNVAMAIEEKTAFHLDRSWYNSTSAIRTISVEWNCLQIRVWFRLHFTFIIRFAGIISDIGWNVCVCIWVYLVLLVVAFSHWITCSTILEMSILRRILIDFSRDLERMPFFIVNYRYDRVHFQTRSECMKANKSKCFNSCHP